MRTLRIHFKDGSHTDCEVTGFSMLPDHFSRSFSLQERKDKKGFILSVGGGLIPESTQVTNMEFIRE